MLFPYLLTPKTEFIYWYAVETMIMDTLIKDTMQGHLHLNDISTNPKMHYIYIYICIILRDYILYIMDIYSYSLLILYGMLKVIHIDHDLRKIFITLVWNDQ